MKKRKSKTRKQGKINTNNDYFFIELASYKYFINFFDEFPWGNWRNIFININIHEQSHALIYMYVLNRLNFSVNVSNNYSSSNRSICNTQINVEEVRGEWITYIYFLKFMKQFQLFAINQCRFIDAPLLLSDLKRFAVTI